jgi:hypothetical protein
LDPVQSLSQYGQLFDAARFSPRSFLPQLLQCAALHLLQTFQAFSTPQNGQTMMEMNLSEQTHNFANKDVIFTFR